MMGVSVKNCAPRREELLRQSTSALLRELCWGGNDMRRSSRSSGFEAWASEVATELSLC